ANGRLAFRLPLDAMRWGAKRQEVMALLAPRARILAGVLGEGAQDQDIRLRLREVQTRGNLLRQYPDQYWAYRKEVKRQLTKRPRSTIRLVSGEEPRRVRHPDDRHRLDYFEALSEAVRHPTAERIRNVETFEEPYDPLISYFLHSEVASLWARSPERDEVAELRHRLHTVYFAPAGARSVRDVIQAMELLREQPAALPDPSVRWDHLNALLQTLVDRWLNRSAVRPSSTQIALNDIDQSILAVQETLRTMDELRAKAGVSSADWKARRALLEKTLVSPLKAYRTQILAHHWKRSQATKQEPKKIRPENDPIRQASSPEDRRPPAPSDDDRPRRRDDAR
ncbi:MAG: hypothetical protein GXP27_08700, partial [Planctomycetes bacterium]|nr:hypothetical protein [Planctomycetota bacterium]